MPCVNAERTSVLLFFYCLQCLWLSLPAWLLEDSLKTNVSLLTAACWLGQRVRKVLMFQMPAPTWISYFCTGVSAGEGRMVWGQQLLVFANTKPSPHSDTQYSRPSSARGSPGSSCFCHQGLRPVIKLLRSARPRPQALNSDGCPTPGVKQWGKWIWLALGWHIISHTIGRHLDMNTWSVSSGEHMDCGLDFVWKVQYSREPYHTQCLERALQQHFPI